MGIAEFRLSLPISWAHSARSFSNCTSLRSRSSIFLRHSAMSIGFRFASVSHPANLLSLAEYSDETLGIVITSETRDLLLVAHRKSRFLAPKPGARNDNSAFFAS